MFDTFQRLFQLLRRGMGDGIAEERRDALRHRQEKKRDLAPKVVLDPIAKLRMLALDRPTLMTDTPPGMEPREVLDPNFRLPTDRLLDRLRTGQVSDEEVKHAVRMVPKHNSAMLYFMANGPFPTTAAQAVVTTGTAIKTMLQVKGVTAATFRIVEWGLSFDGSAAAQPGKCELLETGTVFATVTASVAADLPVFNNASGPTSTTYFSVGTSATGYTSTAEGTITATREYDTQLLPPTGPYVKQFPLGREPDCAAVSSERIRVTFVAAINAYAYVVMEV